MIESRSRMVRCRLSKCCRLLALDGWVKQVGKPNSIQHLVADAVDDAKGDFRAIAGRIDMDAERALAERRIDDLSHCYPREINPAILTWLNGK